MCYDVARALNEFVEVSEAWRVQTFGALIPFSLYPHPTFDAVNNIYPQVKSVYLLVNEIYGEASSFLPAFAIAFIRQFFPVNLPLKCCSPAGLE
jgi:hypothetical protein